MLRFNSATATYYRLQPAPMRVKIITLPQRPAATSVDIRRHSLEPVTFRGTLRLTASSRGNLRAKRQTWEHEQGQIGTLSLPGESLNNVRLMSVRFSPPRRVAGSSDYLCEGVLEFRQESV